MTFSRVLEAKLSRRTRVVIWLIVSLPLCILLARKFSPEAGFMRLLTFGQQFYERAIPEVRALPVPVESPYGYDGQFYAQLAVDPLLRSAQIRGALDSGCLRARRIGVPWLAYVTGLGKPAWILQSYAFLNVAFWGLFAFAMCHFLRPQTVREQLCVVATCLSSGVFFSIQRALLDLPAATLTLCGVSLGGGAVPALAAAILTKETCILALFGLPMESRRPNDVVRLVGSALLALAPFACWSLYVRFAFGGCDEPLGNFSWPFAGYLYAIGQRFTDFCAHREIYEATELLAPLSLLVQVVWLIAIARRPESRYWRMGVAFAVLSVFLSRAPFAEAMACCRDLLPMTIAFNVELMREKTGTFLPWFIAGNIGLTWGVLSVLSF